MREFESTVSGIPCIIRVTEYTDIPASISGPWENSFPAEFEFEFEVLTIKGKPAAWLERKLTDADNYRLVDEFIEWMRKRNDNSI